MQKKSVLFFSFPSDSTFGEAKGRKKIERRTKRFYSFFMPIGIPARADCKLTELQAIVLWHIEANLRKQKYNSNKFGSFMESHYLCTRRTIKLQRI